VAFRVGLIAVTSAREAAKWDDRSVRRLLFGLPAIVLVVVAGFALTPCVARCGDADDLVTETLRQCPRARQLLGDDAAPARFGFACGQTETEGAYGHASWSMPYSGSRGRGTVEYAAEKRAGVWRLDAATLEVDGETIDLVPCAMQTRPRQPQPPKQMATLAQTNADAVTATFDGKVLRSTHPTIATGTGCRGTLSRERGSPFAKVKVECAAAAGSSGSTLYDGTGSFTLDVGDPARRDDDRGELDDSKTTEADGTPGCRLSMSGDNGTLTIWDGAPAYEVVVEL
jgi:hypothetical protein